MGGYWRWVGLATLTVFLVAGNLWSGAHPITATAMDDVGFRRNLTASVFVPPDPLQPEARFSITIDSISMDSAVVGDTVVFNGSASSATSGRLVQWSWNFGDGGGGTGRVVTHMYFRPGQFYPTLFVEDDQSQVSDTSTMLTVIERPSFTEFSSGEGFRLPVPTQWGRQEDVNVGGTVFQLVLGGPGSYDRPTRIAVLTERDPTVQETDGYLGGIVDEVMAGARSDRPDAFLLKTPSYRTISDHAAITFLIRYPSDNLVQEATVIVSETHERYWLLLLTVDSSYLALGHRVLETMVTGFSITLAPAPPRVSGLPLPALAIVAAAGLLGVFIVGLVLRTWAIQGRPQPHGPASMDPVSESLGTFRPAPATFCPTCGSPSLPGAGFCAGCGGRLG